MFDCYQLSRSIPNYVLRRIYLAYVFRIIRYERFSRRPRRILPSDKENKYEERTRFRQGSEISYSNRDLQTDYASENFLKSQSQRRPKPKRYESFQREQNLEEEEIQQQQQEDDEFDQQPEQELPQHMKKKKRSLIPKWDTRKTYSNENGLTWRILGPKDYGFMYSNQIKLNLGSILRNCLWF